jgi:hypothetical protein
MPQLRCISTTSLLAPPLPDGSGGEGIALAIPPRRGVIDRVRRWRTTSDVLCRAPISARLSTWLRSDHRGPLPSPPRQGPRLVRSRTPSIDWCSLRDAFACPNFGGSPPPVSRFCHRRPGFRRVFASPELSPGAARPDVGSEGSSPSVATGRTPPVDFCNLLRSASTSDGSSEPCTPRSWSPTRAAVFRATAFRRQNGSQVAVLLGTANRDVTGQGPALGRSAQ